MFAKLKRINKDEQGQAFILALILMLVGGLTLTPVLNNVASANKAAIQDKVLVSELYAADAGVEDALWAIGVGADELPGEGDSPWLFTVDGSINGRTVNVSVAYISETTYKITSTAVSPDGSSTVITSYINTKEIYGDLFSNALACAGDLFLKDGGTVSGNVYFLDPTTEDYFEEWAADSDNTYIPPDGGGIIPSGTLDFPTDEEDLAFAQQFKDEALTGTIYDGGLSIGAGVTFNFGGPAYINGDLTIGIGATLVLDGSIFVEGSIKASKEFAIEGNGSIVATGDIDVWKLSDYGTDGDGLIMSLYGDITFKKEGIVEALIYAPEGNISFDKGATVIGGIVAGGDIIADKDGSFTYISGDTDIPGEGFRTGIITWTITRP